MLLLLIIILVLIGAAVVGSIYSNFLVFYSNFSETENYHKAYYAAISALERGELVVKQRSPGYEGFAGRYRNQNTNTKQRTGFNGSDGVITSDFSYLSDNYKPSEMIRTVESLTTRIPKNGKGNVEFLLRNYDSTGYNMLGYEDAEVFLLYFDTSDGNPYTKVDCQRGFNGCQDSKPYSITGEIRLPQKLLGDFKELNTEAILVGTNNQTPKDDAIIDRQIRGKYKYDTNKDPVTYTIYSTQKTENNNKKVSYSDDTIFRESDINNGGNFRFENRRNPIRNGSHGTNNPVTIISQAEESIRKNNNFSNLFTKDLSNDSSSQNQLRFSLLNIIRDSNEIPKTYPFLEYYVEFYDDKGHHKSVSDRNYTINGKGSFGDFQVNIPRQKPTVKETVLGNFTSIF